jgi:hypothetical protein
LRDSLEPIRRRRIRIIKKRINSLPTKHAIGNTRANAMLRQKKSLRIDYLRLKSVCRNKLINKNKPLVVFNIKKLTGSQESGKKKKK